MKVVEEGIVIRTWVEPGFKPIILIIIVIIRIAVMIIIIISSSLGFQSWESVRARLKKNRGVEEGGRSHPRGGGVWVAPPICKW